MRKVHQKTSARLCGMNWLLPMSTLGNWIAPSPSLLKCTERMFHTGESTSVCGHCNSELKNRRTASTRRDTRYPKAGSTVRRKLAGASSHPRSHRVKYRVELRVQPFEWQLRL